MIPSCFSIHQADVPTIVLKVAGRRGALRGPKAPKVANIPGSSSRCRAGRCRRHRRPGGQEWGAWGTQGDLPPKPENSPDLGHYFSEGSIKKGNKKLFDLKGVHGRGDPPSYAFGRGRCRGRFVGVGLGVGVGYVRLG